MNAMYKNFDQDFFPQLMGYFVGGQAKVLTSPRTTFTVKEGDKVKEVLSEQVVVALAGEQDGDYLRFMLTKNPVDLIEEKELLDGLKNFVNTRFPSLIPAARACTRVLTGAAAA